MQLYPHPEYSDLEGGQKDHRVQLLSEWAHTGVKATTLASLALFSKLEQKITFLSETAMQQCKYLGNTKENYCHV